MPVVFVKRSRKEPAPEPRPEVEIVKPEPVVTTGGMVRPVIHKTIHIGKSQILPDMDVHDVPGHTKFLINLFKMEQNLAIWYRIIGYDEDTHQIKLASRHKNTFDTKLPTNAVDHYMVAMEPGNAVIPSSAVFSEIRKLVLAAAPKPETPAPVPPKEESKPRSKKKK